MSSKFSYEEAEYHTDKIQGTQNKSKYSEFGLCASCQFFAGVERAVGGDKERFGYCRMFTGAFGVFSTLDPSRPVTDCSVYSKSTGMTLPMMLAMAKPIDNRDALPEERYL